MTDEPALPARPSALDVENIPADPAAVIAALASALAAVHLGRADRPATDGPVLDHAVAAEAAASAIDSGWTPPAGSQFERVAAATLRSVVLTGLDRVRSRPGSDLLTWTIGDATFANLALPAAPMLSAAPTLNTDPVLTTDPTLPAPKPGAGLSGAANVTFRTRTDRSTALPSFASTDHAALSDPYRDLAMAMVDVIATFGPGAVLGFVEAYANANPGVEPVDPIRLDWWSMVTAVIGSEVPETHRSDRL